MDANSTEPKSWNIYEPLSPNFEAIFDLITKQNEIKLSINVEEEQLYTIFYSSTFDSVNRFN